MKKVCIITAARSEYGLLRWTIDGVQQNINLELQLVVTGAHLMAEHGYTYKCIEEDGYPISAKVDMGLNSDSRKSSLRLWDVAAWALQRPLPHSSLTWL